MGERTEALIRIPVAIVTGIILYIFSMVVQLITFVHWFYVIIGGKRSASLAKFCNSYCSLQYKFIRYLTFTTNQRPIPFGPSEEIKRVDMGKKRR